MIPDIWDLYKVWVEGAYPKFFQYAQRAEGTWLRQKELWCPPCNEFCYPIIYDEDAQIFRIGGREWRIADPSFTFDFFSPFIEAHIYHHGWKGGLIEQKNRRSRR